MGCRGTCHQSQPEPTHSSIYASVSIETAATRERWLLNKSRMCTEQRCSSLRRNHEALALLDPDFTLKNHSFHNGLTMMASD